MTTEMNKTETKEQGVKNIQPNIGLDKDVLKQDNEMLNAYLADLHVLYIKTRKYHWNVAGPRFKEYHEFFEEQYHLKSTAEWHDVLLNQTDTAQWRCSYWR